MNHTRKSCRQEGTYLLLIYQLDIPMPTANRIPDDLQHLLPLTPAVFFILFALWDGEKHGYAITQTVFRISENQSTVNHS